jgi:hypothetical protein
MRTKAAVALVIAAFLLGGLIVGSVGLSLARKPKAPQVANTATVIQQIQALSDLVTVKYVMEKVVIFTNSATTTLGQLPNVMKLPGFEEDRITLLAHGVVKGGVDLAKIKVDDVQAENKRITVRLPKAVIMDAYLDETRTQVMDRRSGLFRSFDRTLEQQARQYAWSEMHRAARAGGIEREAETRAREQLQRLLRSLGYSEIEFK